MTRCLKKGKRFLSIITAMVLVMSLFSVTALAADKPQAAEEDIDYSSILNALDEDQTTSIDDNELLNTQSFQDKINKAEDAINGTADYEDYLYADINETEVNDEFSSANVINNSYAGIPQYNITGKINDDYKDLDCFEITVTAPGEIYIYGLWCDQYYDKGLESELLYGIFDSSGDLIDVADLYLYSDGTTARYLYCYLTAGTYYIAVAQKDTYQTKFVGEEYLLLIDFISDTPSVSYQTHVQNIGWMDWCSNGATGGTSGQSLRMEAMRISLGYLWDDDGGIEYQTHVQNIGWMDWVSDGELSGTSGQSLRLEAIKIRLTGDIAEEYDVYYRVHAQNIGWMGWAKNGEASGTAGYGYRLEAIQIVLVDKGSAAPGNTANAFIQA